MTELRGAVNVSPSPLPRSLLSLRWMIWLLLYSFFNRERTRRSNQRGLPVLFKTDFLIIGQSAGFLVTTWPSQGFAFREGVI